MKRLIIKTLKNEELQRADFESEKGLNDFIGVLKDGKTAWGNWEKEEIEFDESGKEVSKKIIPAEFSYEIFDISEEVESERVKKESKDDLKKIDWDKVKTIADIKAILKTMLED